MAETAAEAEIDAIAITIAESDTTHGADQASEGGMTGNAAGPGLQGVIEIIDGGRTIKRATK